MLAWDRLSVCFWWVGKTKHREPVPGYVNAVINDSQLEASNHLSFNSSMLYFSTYATLSFIQCTHEHAQCAAVDTLEE